MAIKTSGPISINDIVAEFGGSAPHSLSEYYAGGSLVPATPTNSAIPSSGPIAYDDFYGASKIITMSYTFYSGGGAGGNGYQDGAGTGSAAAGSVTGIITKAKYNEIVAAYNGVWPSPGFDDQFIVKTSYGTGGTNGTEGDTGTAGGDSDFGTGGAGGASWSSGSGPAWGSWAAGGGGGGGDPAGGTDTSLAVLLQPSGGTGGNIDDQAMGYYGGGTPADEAGKGGKGGSSGDKLTGTLSLTPGDYVIILGSGGHTFNSAGNFNGAYGAPGAAKFKLDTGTTNYTVTPDSTNALRYNTSDLYGGRFASNYGIFFTISKNGTVTFTAS